jgi:hypothetical protein
MPLTVFDHGAPLATQTIVFYGGMHDRTVVPVGAEWLVKWTDAVHPDPVKDLRGSYKAGYPVVVRPVGSEWGRLEVLPPTQGGKFVRIIMPDVTVEQVGNFTKTRWNQDAIGGVLDASNLVTRRRGIRFRFDLMTQAQRDTLNTVGVLTLPWTSARAALEHITSGQRAG